ncbi:MAG: hypothetical protein KGS72_20680 [Cyanobacteria bacterium REEB67]|nr:hypothetical protein [Cyanobacteria bacterium REEB67]
MTMIKVYLWGPKQRLIVPTMAETESGFFVETDPLFVYECHDIFHWKNHLIKSLDKGMKKIDTPDNALEPGSAILEKLELNSWAEFEKQATLFTIHRGPRYISIYATGPGDDGMWSHAAMSERKFHTRAPVAIVVEALVQDIIKHPKASKPQPLLLTSSGG